NLNERITEKLSKGDIVSNHVLEDLNSKFENERQSYQQKMK
ncbi:28239_t:CDS:1, partial [Dentiscutata erythropus]